MRFQGRPWFLEGAGGPKRSGMSGPDSCTHGWHTQHPYMCAGSHMEHHADQRSQAKGQGCQPQWCWEA